MMAGPGASFMGPWLGIICFSLVYLVVCAAQDDLIAQLKKVAGVFTDSSLVEKFHLEKTVVVAAANYGYLNHLFNFDCFAKRLGMKYLVMSLDERLHRHLNEHTSLVSYYFDKSQHAGSGDIGSGDSKVGTEPASFRSKQFNLISTRKNEAVHDIMGLGYDILFSDADVAILQNPFPYLQWPGVDYVHSLNGHCRFPQEWDYFTDLRAEGNTGFYFVRANNESRQIWSNFFVATEKKIFNEVRKGRSPHTDLDDQTIFWRMLRAMHSGTYHFKDDVVVPINAIGACDASHKGSSTSFTLCGLDNCLFSAGMLSGNIPEMTYDALMRILRKNYPDQGIVSLHANWMDGNHLKMQRLQEHGLWLAEINADLTHYTCQKYVPKKLV